MRGINQLKMNLKRNSDWKQREIVKALKMNQWILQLFNQSRIAYWM